jgi:hypothetical protein
MAADAAVAPCACTNAPWALGTPRLCAALLLREGAARVLAVMLST